MKNIDLEIYKQQLENGIDFDGMSEEFGCDKNDLIEVFLEELEIKAEANLIEHDDVRLTEIQFTECIMASVTKVTLNKMIKEGLIEANFDIEKGENVYLLTDLGKEHAGKMDI